MTMHEPGERNPYFASPRENPTESSLGVEELSADECWRLMQSGNVGRLAMIGTDGRPDVLPMNFVVYDETVVLRTAPGGKLQAIFTNPAVAFEVDGADVWRHWSVVLRGEAERMDSDDVIEASGALELFSWSPTAKHNFVRLTPDTVTGRRFRKRLPAVQDDQGDQARDEKPSPIPHYPPLE